MAGIDIDTILNAIPGDKKVKGLQKLGQILIQKGTELDNQLPSSITNLVSQFTPGSCPDPAVLQSIVEKRNNIVGKLNTVGQFLDVVTSSYIGVSSFLDVVLFSISNLKNIKIGVSAAAKAIPFGLPGVIPASLSDLEDLKNKILFNTTGGPQLEKSIANLNSGVLAINAVNQQLSKIITLLNSIDNVLKKCSPDSDLVPLNGNLILLQQTIQEQQNILPQQNQSTVSETPTNIYQGFTLEIQEIPFSEGLVQKVGIAKNNEGVILLKTKPSFTLNPQILIEELQFIINRDSLKAN